jgi:hypothetical protein
MNITDKIKETIEILKGTDIEGCISGSCMLPDKDFSLWEDVPDVDVFVYNEWMLLYASDLLMLKHGFELCNEGEKWKFNRVRTRGQNSKAPLTTLKLQKDGVVVNLTYKKYKTNLINVLSSFDQSGIMIGYDIPFGFGLDMRTKDIKVFDDRHGRWSDSPDVSVPNPMRKQDADMYTTEMWVRQFSRVIKYWKRGFDTRPMARFYIDLINKVLETGALFSTDKSTEAYEGFKTMYEPLRDKMVAWLEDKEDC